MSFFVSAAVSRLRQALANSANGSGADLIGGVGRVVSNIAAMRALLVSGVGRAFVLGYYAAGDGGGGAYYLDAADLTSPEDGVGVIVATDGGRWKPVITGVLNARSAGLRMDGVTSDRTRLIAAIAYCQATAQNLRFGKGIPTIDAKVTLDGVPISFIGEEFPSKQQGSQLPGCTLRWTGGADAMFSMVTAGWSFVGMAVENRGTATDFIESSTTQYLTLDTVSFLVATGAARFSRSVLRTPSNAYGYSRFRNIAYQGAAPRFLDVDGNGSPNGITAIEFDGGLWESNGLGSVVIVYLKDINVTGLSMHNLTGNQQDNELCFVDTTDTPRSITLAQFSFRDNEVDTVTNVAGNRGFKLTNATNVTIEDNYFQGGGNRTAFAALINTQVSSFKGNRGERINGPFFSADALSNVVIGKNEFNTANTQGFINDTATGSGIVDFAFGGTVTLLGQLLGPLQTARVNVSGVGAWNLSIAHPGIGAGGFFYRGQKFWICLRNTSGGAMTAPTINAAYFKIAGGAFPTAANGFNRSVLVEWMGTHLEERGRTTVDVPN